MGRQILQNLAVGGPTLNLKYECGPAIIGIGPKDVIKKSGSGFRHFASKQCASR